MTTLVVTNDFPPRLGGIESFVADLCAMLHHDLGQSVIVLTSRPRTSSRDLVAHDSALPFPVLRMPTPVLLPTAEVTATASRLVHRHDVDRVVFGAAAPLALMARALRTAGVQRILAITHGHERWWARLPVSRAALRRIGDDVDVLSVISDDVAATLRPALSRAAAAKLVRLPPPVDLDRFCPEKSTTSPPRCVAVGRLVRRKGFAELLAAWALVLGAWPASTPRPELVLVGDGPQASRLRAQAGRLKVPVRFAGALPRSAVVGELRRGDVFAFPVRDQRFGLDQEGLGLAAVEAAACGLPVVVGRSGGAAETVQHGRTGYLLTARGTDAFVAELADRLGDLLLDPGRATAMGAAGRAYVAERFGADRVRDVLRQALQL